MSKLIAEMESAARAIRGFGMTLSEAADALELVLKKFNTEAIGICELCNQPGYRNGSMWLHTAQHRGTRSN
jgi:hypothetical protein